MEAAEITAAAGLAAVIIAVIGLAATAIYRVGKLTEATNRLPQEMQGEFQSIRVEFQRIYDRFEQNEHLTGRRFQSHEELIRHNEELIRRNEELIRSEGERTRQQIRNLHQAIMSHSHDEDGSVMFRIPPPEPDE